MRDWVVPYIKQYKGRLVLAIFLAFLGILSAAMLLFVSGYLISKSALKPENVMLIYVPIVSVRAFSIGQAAFPYVEKLVSHDLVLRILAKMRKRLYQIVEPQALLLRSRYQTGDLLSILSDDIEHLQDLYLRSIIPSIIGTVVYTILVIVLGIFDWVFAMMMIFLLGVLVFLIPLISFHKTKRNQVTWKENHQSLYQQVTDAIFGLTDWQASGRTDEFLEAQGKQDDKLVKTQQQMQSWTHIRNALIQGIVGIFVICMLLWANKQAGLETITPTLIAAFTLMALSVADALTPVSDAVEHIPTYHDSLKRIKQIESGAIISGEADQSNPVSSNNWVKNQDTTLTLEGVTYHYPNTEKNILHDLSVTIPPGKKVAILGKSGTGKSTLLNMISGVLQPTEGKVWIGESLVKQNLLGRAVSVLNQKPHLFDTTIENNIRIGKQDARAEEIHSVIEQAQLSELIASLPKGIQTPMEEMGNRFSGGERQRIAFARVLLQDTPILLVDEATIGLDPKTEKELMHTVLDAARDKTIIWITHHLTGVEQMDEVIFLQDGNIAMSGSHDTLLKTNTHYQTLYQMDQGIY